MSTSSSQVNLPRLQVWTSTLSLFLLLTVMGNAIVNTVDIIVRTHTFISVGAVRCWNILSLSSKAYFSCFPEMQSYDFPIPLLTLLLLVFLMIAQWVCSAILLWWDLLFFHDKNDTEHLFLVFICHLFIFFGEIPIQIPCPLLN